jgi:NADPH:quinone reductase-like Zn-dependent oxidoreductase
MSPTSAELTHMQALVVDPSAPLGIAFADVPTPCASPGVAVVEVRHISLNHGDLNDARSGRIAVGDILGSDLAGVVVTPASDATGPAVGTRVVGVGPGAFASRCAVAVGALAPVPESVSLARAVGLPVAGLAALQALRAAGSGPGKRVLVTGASGGVGRFAVQLAALDRAHVIASVGSVGRGDGLAALGAAEVVVALADVRDPVDIVVEGVGGPTLVQAWSLLAPGGSLQSIGWTSGEPAVFEPYSTVGPPKSFSSFLIGGDIGADLATLVGLLARGALQVEIGWEGPWTDVATAAEAMLGRTIAGKAVLDVS